MWPSGLSIIPQTKRSLVQFPVRAHAWVAGQIRSPVGGVWEATTYWCFSPSLSPSLPLSLKINKYNIFLNHLKVHSFHLAFAMLTCGPHLFSLDYRNTNLNSDTACWKIIFLPWQVSFLEAQFFCLIDKITPDMDHSPLQISMFSVFWWIFINSNFQFYREILCILYHIYVSTIAFGKFAP